MKEIEYRAWDIARKVMMYAGCEKNWRGDKDEWYGDNVGMVLDAIKDVQKRENVILLQYTGLKDKHGKKIFEGDILKVVSGNKIVKYEAATGFFGEIIDGENPSYCDVIGNVYENPELLEG